MSAGSKRMSESLTRRCLPLSLSHTASTLDSCIHCFSALNGKLDVNAKTALESFINKAYSWFGGPDKVSVMQTRIRFEHHYCNANTSNELWMAISFPFVFHPFDSLINEEQERIIWHEMLPNYQHLGYLAAMRRGTAEIIMKFILPKLRLRPTNSDTVAPLTTSHDIYFGLYLSTFFFSSFFLLFSFSSVVHSRRTTTIECNP